MLGPAILNMSLYGGQNVSVIIIGKYIQAYVLWMECRGSTETPSLTTGMGLVHPNKSTSIPFILTVLLFSVYRYFTVSRLPVTRTIQVWYNVWQFTRDQYTPIHVYSHVPKQASRIRKHIIIHRIEVPLLFRMCPRVSYILFIFVTRQGHSSQKAVKITGIQLLCKMKEQQTQALEDYIKISALSIFS